MEEQQIILYKCLGLEGQIISSGSHISQDSLDTGEKQGLKNVSLYVEPHFTSFLLVDITEFHSVYSFCNVLSINVAMYSGNNSKINPT